MEGEGKLKLKSRKVELSNVITSKCIEKKVNIKALIQEIKEEKPK